MDLEDRESPSYFPTNDESEDNGLSSGETGSPKIIGVPCPSNLHQFLSSAIQQEASDLHLSADYPPTVRIHGNINPLDGNAVMTSADILSIFQSITPFLPSPF